MSEFTCARCHETFVCGWSDEEARAELERDFPGVDVANCNLLCDDCYRELVAWRTRNREKPR